MLANYLKVAFRSMTRNKGYSTINIFGLAIGMACSILLLLWVQDELAFDRFQRNIDCLHRVVNEDSGSGTVVHSAVTPAPLATALKDQFPEIERASRWGELGGAWVTYGDLSFSEQNIALADPDALEMFTFPLVRGELKSALSNKYSVLITEEMASKYFGSDEPIGKVLRIDNEKNLTVTGVLKNIPKNSSLWFDFLIPFEYLRDREDINFWSAYRYYTFVQLNSNASIETINEKISGEIARHVSGSNDKLYLQPYAEIHLNSDLAYDKMGTGDTKYVWIFSALALFVLAIAGINFMNLATARSASRIKEIGLRKIVGAHKMQLVRQFIGESLLMSFLGSLLAVALAELMLPGFSSLSGKVLESGIVGRPDIILGLVVIMLATGIMSGIHPALILSSIKPEQALKRRAQSCVSGLTFRRILVVVQFTLSIGLIIATVVVIEQHAYMRDKDLGFDSEQVIYMPMRGCPINQYKTLKEELLRNPEVKYVTAAFQFPTNIGSSPGEMKWEGKEAGQDVRINAGLVDYDYFETFGMEMADGRMFSKDISSGATVEYIVNESAVKAMGMDSPIGKSFSFWDSTGTIVGVVKDFHSQPLHKQINPIVLKLDPYWLNYVYVKIKPGKTREALSAIESSWKKLSTGYPCDVHFLDERIDNQYRTERRIGSILKYFTALCIIIACLGLFALASYTAEQRTREIGIRKALGATASGIAIMISREFLFLVVIANVVAWPIAYIVMTDWLSTFVYRTELGLATLVIAGTAALMVALLAVGYQAIRAALANPIDALRHE